MGINDKGRRRSVTNDTNHNRRSAVSKFTTHTIAFCVTRENDDVELKIEGAVNSDTGDVEILAVTSDNHKWSGELSEVETVDAEEAIAEKARADEYWEDPADGQWNDDGSLEDTEVDDAYDPV